MILDVCPTSNLCLKVFPDISSHVFPLLYQAGVRVTVNSDDPAMFNTTLNREYELLAETFGFGMEDFYKFNRNAADGALLPENEKEQLLKRFEEEWGSLK